MGHGNHRNDGASSETMTFPNGAAYAEVRVRAVVNACETFARKRIGKLIRLSNCIQVMRPNTGQVSNMFERFDTYGCQAYGSEGSNGVF